MNFKEACKIIEDEFPNLKRTGNAYEYGDYFCIEMVDKQSDAGFGVLDGLFLINKKTKKVKPYNPILDGIHDLAKIKPIH